MAPPGKPKTSFTPNFSRLRKIAPEPVRISGVVLFGRGAGSEDMCESFKSKGELTLTGDRAAGGGLHKLRILGENASRVTRRKGGPAFSAGFELSGVDK